MSSEKYFAADNADDSENLRLSLLERVYDPVSQRRLSQIGIGSGWHCLDVGPGRGTMTCWLAKQVGSTGHVVSADIDPRFLQTIDIPNVTVQQSDILGGPVAAGSFDLVYSRFLFCHLCGDEGALANMVESLKPGGLLVIEDIDFGYMVAANQDHPFASQWDSRFPEICNYFQERRWLDCFIGRKLEDKFAQAGLSDVGGCSENRLARGGSPSGEFWSHTFDVAWKEPISEGEIDQADLDATKAALADPSFSFVEPPFYTVWGRR